MSVVSAGREFVVELQSRTCARFKNTCAQILRHSPRKSGNFFGTTAHGGVILFPSWRHRRRLVAICRDMDTKDDIYGTTVRDGASDSGTVFKVTD